MSDDYGGDDYGGDGSDGGGFDGGGGGRRSGRLCPRMNYPDDAGRAEVDHCLAMTGPRHAPTFTCTDRDRANVVVTGRAGGQPGAGFRGDDGATTWRHNDFPELGYTVCWRWR